MTVFQLIWFIVSITLSLLIYLRGSLFFGGDSRARGSWSGCRRVGKGLFSLLWGGAWCFSSSFCFSNAFKSHELRAGLHILPLLTQEHQSLVSMSRGEWGALLILLALLIWFWCVSSFIFGVYFKGSFNYVVVQIPK